VIVPPIKLRVMVSLQEVRVFQFESVNLCIWQLLHV